jgi:hypothetical protein
MADSAKDGIQGEGDYISARKYQDAQHKFAKDGPVEQKAKEAEEAIEGPEGAELEAARVETAKGEPHRKA